MELTPPGHCDTASRPSSGQRAAAAYVLFPITLLMFIWTLSCLRLMANTTSVSQGVPWGPAAFPFLAEDGVDVLVTESGRQTSERVNLKVKDAGQKVN